MYVGRPTGRHYTSTLPTNQNEGFYQVRSIILITAQRVDGGVHLYVIYEAVLHVPVTTDILYFD